MFLFFLLKVYWSTTLPYFHSCCHRDVGCVGSGGNGTYFVPCQKIDHWFRWSPGVRRFFETAVGHCRSEVQCAVCPGDLPFSGFVGGSVFLLRAMTFAFFPRLRLCLAPPLSQLSASVLLGFDPIYVLHWYLCSRFLVFSFSFFSICFMHARFVSVFCSHLYGSFFCIKDLCDMFIYTLHWW